VINIYESEAMGQTIQKLLPVITTSIRKNIEKKQSFGLVLAGGNTPKSLYEALAKQDIEWPKVTITLTDERWVPVDHIDSNENMIRRYLLSKLDAAPVFVPLKTGGETIDTTQKACEALLNEKLTCLDAVILGMGGDGHFASIFPCIDNLTELLDVNNKLSCMAVAPQGKQQRMSLTLSYLLSAKNIFLLITGEDKIRIIKEIVDGGEKAQRYPIYHLLNQNKCPVNIYWNP
jgi:6-phosphogluconolactonase